MKRKKRSSPVLEDCFDRLHALIFEIDYQVGRESLLTWTPQLQVTADACAAWIATARRAARRGDLENCIEVTTLFRNELQVALDELQCYLKESGDG
jgi:hypothetical protein